MAADLPPRRELLAADLADFMPRVALASAPVRITLIDRRNYHLFRPML